MLPNADIGIIGGSGLYELLTDADEVEVDTPFGAPSDRIIIGTFGGASVAFVPRHGRGHRIPPHRINYRANLWALKQVGIQRLIVPCAVGSLRRELEPGTFVVTDQVVDRTWGRPDTFHEGSGSPDERVAHVSLAEPYCPQLRRLAVEVLGDTDIPFRDRGTMVVIQGPRFSTAAESRWYAAQGWHTIGMTQYPEVALARELALCTAGIALVTDYDAGLEDDPSVEAVTGTAVLEVFQRNVARLRGFLERLVAVVPGERPCGCADALDEAYL